MSLVKENQEIEQIIFKTDDHLSNFIEQLQTNYLDLMKRPLQVIRLSQMQSLRTKVDFLNWPNDCDHKECSCEQSCFKIDVDLHLSSHVSLPDYSIQLDQQNVYLVSSKSGKPTKQMPLVCL